MTEHGFLAAMLALVGFYRIFGILERAEGVGGDIP